MTGNKSRLCFGSSDKWLAPASEPWKNESVDGSQLSACELASTVLEATIRRNARLATCESKRGTLSAGSGGPQCWVISAAQLGACKHSSSLRSRISSGSGPQRRIASWKARTLNCGPRA
jgi:hypothetical protein